MKTISVLIYILCTTALSADIATPLTGAEFDALTRGKTLTYYSDGTPYGVEEYLTNHRVRWAFEDGECRYGRWNEPETGLICFVYEYDPNNPQCWNFYKTFNSLTAHFVGPDGDSSIYDAKKQDGPLQCHGPQVGV